MPRQNGFSLVELLVVLGLIAVLVGGIGLARRDGDGGVALQSGQAQALALMRAAQAEAIARQVPVRLLISSALPSAREPEFESYLRRLQIAHQAEEDGEAWKSEGAAIFLSPGIFVVPPVVPASHLMPGVVWPTGVAAPVSIVDASDSILLSGQGSPVACFSIEFEPDGTTSPSGARLVVGAARPSHGLPPRFENPRVTAGVGVTSSGGIGPLPPFKSF